MKQSSNNEKGQALMLSVVFFIIVSVAIVFGLVSPAAKQFRIANNSLLSKQSYLLAESGVEDAYYRLKTSKNISSTEVLVLGASSTTTTITDLGGGDKEINAIGDVFSRERKVKANITTAQGVAFNYGVQVGAGGLSMSGSGGIVGNVYANGPITGDSSSYITGTAISGNSPALSASVSNGTGTPSNDIVFGNANGTQDFAQSFQVSSTDPINKFQVYIKKTSTPSNLTARIVTDSSGSPSTTQIASDTLSSSSVSSVYGWVDVPFSSAPVLTPGVTYWLVLDGSSSSSKYYTIGANAGGYSSGVGKIGRYSNSWSNTSPSGLDAYFKVFTGGFTGLIQGSSLSQWNRLHIGTGGSGEARAYEVNYTDATGDIMCQVGTGNNKSCTTSGSVPGYEAMPVSEANVTEWKNTASAGGTISGNYSVGWAGATVGPKKISGNLSVSGGGILTVSGTLWVTGNLTLNGGGKIQLDSSYGTNDGVIVVDGTISVSGGAFADGSGTAGSYIMLLSTKSGSSAISLSGGSGAVILYAMNGEMSISGGAHLREAVAYELSISGGSSVTYESGLADLNFSSGPSGSYSINSWEEAQ